MNHQVFSAIQSTDLSAAMKFRVSDWSPYGSPCYVRYLEAVPQTTNTEIFYHCHKLKLRSKVETILL